MEAAAPRPNDAPDARLALIALDGRQMAYAEVERGATPRLRRLGTCDFEADAAAAVFADGASGGGDADALSALTEALAEVFAGIDAHRLVVVAHPTDATAFFTPLPAGLPGAARDEQLRQEAALLADAPPTQPVRVHAAPVRTESGHAPDGSRRTWYHVLHVPEAVHARLALLATATGATGYDLAETARSAAALLGPAGEASDGPSLAVGFYPAHTEVALVDADGALAFAYHGAGDSPEDTAYYALAAAERVGAAPGAVARVGLYGDLADATPRAGLLAEMTGRTPAPLDPFAPFGRRPDGLDDAGAAAFAPLLGAALAGGAPDAPGA